MFVVVNVLFETFASAFGAVAQLHGQEMFRHGLPVGSGILTFAILNFHPKIVAWADEVVTEVRKVVWPSQKDTTAMTIVVCVMVIFAGIGFGLFDWAASMAIKMFVNAN